MLLRVVMTANIEKMGSMFQYATSFNQDISSWNVGKVVDFLATFSSGRLPLTLTSVPGMSPAQRAWPECSKQRLSSTKT